MSESSMARFVLLVRAYGDGTGDAGTRWTMLCFHTAEARKKADAFVKKYDRDAATEFIDDWG